jgi:hypothetical protein
VHRRAITIELRVTFTSVSSLSYASAPSLRPSSLSLALLLLRRSRVLGLVLGLDLLEALDVLGEVGVLRELDEELGLLLLAVLLAAVHRDGLRADLHELGVLISTKDISTSTKFDIFVARLILT